MDERTQHIYSENADIFSRRYSHADMTSVQKLMLRYLPPCGKVLEIGCGSGRDASFLCLEGFNVTATDGSVEMLRQASRRLVKHEGSGKIKFMHAAFPLQSSDKLFHDKFDAVVSIGVIMHVPDQDIFEFAYQIRNLLKDGGTLFLSSSLNRSDLNVDSRDRQGRLFRERPITELRLLFERLGLRFLASHETTDSFQRDGLRWFNLIFTLDPNACERPVDQIEIIINRDRKTATYKLALLRALCEIAQTAYHHVLWNADDTISIPLGLVTERWLYYYWPLMEGNISQIRGGGKTHPEAFRTYMLDLINHYKNNGGMNAFHISYQNRNFTEIEKSLISRTLQKIANTIVAGPVKFSSQGDFSHQKHPGRKNKNTIDGLIGSLGFIRLRADVWREMCLLGHWISEAILLRWAELTFDITKRQVPVSKVLEKLLEGPETDRQITAAKEIYLNMAEIKCTWTQKVLTPRGFDIDHIIPFSLWHNNELWNLVPAGSRVNNQKRDKLVSREVLFRSRDMIIPYWQHQRTAMPDRFDREIGRSLLGRTSREKNWEVPAFTALCEAIETVALQRGIERWSPV